MSIDQDNIYNNFEMGCVPSPSPPPVVSQRSGQRICMPAHFADFLPGSTTHLAHMPPSDCQQCGRHDDVVVVNPQPHTPSPPQSEQEDPFLLIPFKTDPDKAGLYHLYHTHPTLPSNNNTLKDVTDAPTLVGGGRILELSRITEGLSSKEIGEEDLYAAFSNPTSGLLIAYQYSGTGQQSVAELQCLTTFIGDLLFQNSDVLSFSHTQEAKNIDAYLQDKANPFHEEYGWHHSTVKIRLPKEEDHLIEVISEAYSSPEMLETYMEVNALPRKVGDEYECAIASLMFWSDTTHLVNFGDTSLCPFYLFFGNQSEYTRGKPTTSACHHVANIPSLLDDLQDQYMDIFGEATTSQVYMHCKCKLMQANWVLLLDDKFMHAYQYGIVVGCGDGVTHRIFPQFFTDLADYPEKVQCSMPLWQLTLDSSPDHLWSLFSL
ncbi:hypothetical protein BDR03DRAFT_981822 [Suillus americanus]|nr:hypothetical protein BDR03DRAFT_981822 [Suillus americanus]